MSSFSLHAEAVALSGLTEPRPKASAATPAAPAAPSDAADAPATPVRPMVVAAVDTALPASVVEPAPPPLAPERVELPPPLPRPHPAKREPARPASEPKLAMATPPAAAMPEPNTRRKARDSSRLPEPSESRTAVYDISASKVYMPNGDMLEAHSGLGSRMDDPRYVHVRMRGPTPPNVYRLTMREKLFHGVEAIRLNPLDNSKMFGRDGMLAHTYMLGSNGQSNGCVSFKHYAKFLNAFKKGEVDRLVVVSSLGNESWRAVSAGKGRALGYAAED
jgi:hypothetical protein